MNAITIDAQVSLDRQLIYTLPPEVPVGHVKLIILPIEAPDTTNNQPLTREEARRRLLAAGKLVTTLIAPPDAVALSDEEREQIGRLFGDESVTTLDLIDQDRGPKE